MLSMEQACVPYGEAGLPMSGHITVSYTHLDVYKRQILDRKGPTTHSYQELEAKKAMVRQSERIYVLADSDKFRESGFHTMCLWEEIDGIITDGSLSAKAYEHYEKNVPIWMAQEDEYEENR